jgi:molybdopterin converting factor small subunit
MEQTNRSITVSLKLFNRAFPERISLTLQPGARVRDLMARVEGSSLFLKELGQDDLLLILNGRPVQNLQGYDTPLEDGDVLAVFPVMAGG